LQSDRKIKRKEGADYKNGSELSNKDWEILRKQVKKPENFSFGVEKFKKFEKDISKYLVYFAEKPKLKVYTVHRFLEGVAGVWSTQYPKQHSETFAEKSFEQYMQALAEEYGEREDLSTVLIKLENLKMGKDLNTYIEDFVTLITDATNLDNIRRCF
jgi:hypothetical protein